MIIVMDVHQVIGERELDFEDTYRDVYLPEVGSAGDARLLWFGWSPHGGGEGYEAVTLTAYRDIEAWDGYSERLRYGDLAERATDVDAMRYTLHTSVHVPADWSPLASLDLAGVPTAVQEHDPVLMRLDSIEPNGSLDDLQAALAKAAADHDGRLLELVGSWSSCFGDAAGDAVHVLYRVADRNELAAALGHQDASSTWPGSLASAIDRPATRTRLLRMVRWSPLA